MELKTHSITLTGEHITLRPMTEDDWPMLLEWNNDPQVLYYAEGDDVSSRSLEEVQDIYRSVSQNALCFIIEYQGQPIGECWLQQMNLERILAQYPGYDLRRIDLTIGDRRFWNQGLGTEAIRLLTRLAFEQEGADYVFGLVGDHNPRSRRAFEKNGYRLSGRVAEPPGGKAAFSLDLVAKNPRLGFHSYAVHLFFDLPTENIIRDVWRELAEREIAPYLHQSDNRPHLTLAIYRALDLPEAARRLEALAAARPPQAVSFQHYGIFPTTQPTAFLGPLVTPALLELHAAVNAALDGLAELPDFDHYRPGRWVPHCGLAINFDAAHLYDALEVIRRLSLPLDGKISEIGLIEMRPVRHLGCWAFGGPA